MIAGALAVRSAGVVSNLVREPLATRPCARRYAGGVGTRNVYPLRGGSPWPAARVEQGTRLYRAIITPFALAEALSGCFICLTEMRAQDHSELLRISISLSYHN
jgi:hypothetical protein